jgi:hypothetical protein
MWDMARGWDALYDSCSIVIILLNNREKERSSLVVYKVKQVEWTGDEQY